jgi:preprotein translocase subunit SecE
MAVLLDFVKDSYKEMTQKVSWPGWSSLQSSAVLVLVASAIIALLILAMDESSSRILDLFYKSVN